MFRQAVKEADHLEVQKWRSAWLALEEIAPSEDKEPSDELIRIMSKTPWKIPPIIVEPPGVTDQFYILDGNHRYEAAKQLGLPGLWVVILLEGKWLL